MVPEARRSGLGAALVARAGLEPDIGVIHLEVREDNPGARAFYEALEFQQTGRREGYYQDGTAALRLSRNVLSVR